VIGVVERLPAEAEAKYNKYMKLREMLVNISRERLSIESMISEIESVLDELKNVPDDAETYRMIGSVLVKKPKSDIVKELEERKEELEIRAKALKGQEDALKSELDKLGKELQKILMGGKGGATGGTAG